MLKNLFIIKNGLLIVILAVATILLLPALAKAEEAAPDLTTAPGTGTTSEGDTLIDAEGNPLLPATSADGEPAGSSAVYNPSDRSVTIDGWNITLEQGSSADESPSADNSTSGSEACPQGYTCLDNPLANKATDLPTIIGVVIKGFMGVAGALVLLMVIWGAQGWTLAAGNPEKIKAGVHTIIWALVGAAVLFLAYILLNFALGFLLAGPKG